MLTVLIAVGVPAAVCWVIATVLTARGCRDELRRGLDALDRGDDPPAAAPSP